jgi:hypothetical protein
MVQWEVAKSQGTCIKTGRTFAEGDEYYAVLIDTPEGFVRQDYAPDAWTEPPAEAYCFWKTRVPRKEEKKKLIVDNTVLIEFFERLAEDQEPAKQQFRFVLALMLMRKRLLRYVKSANVDGVETWTMLLTRDDSVLEVVNPHLGDEEIESVSEQLTAILHGDFLDEYGDQLATPSASDTSDEEIEDESESEGKDDVEAS